MKKVLLSVSAKTKTSTEENKERIVLTHLASKQLKETFRLETR